MYFVKHDYDVKVHNFFNNQQTKLIKADFYDTNRFCHNLFLQCKNLLCIFSPIASCCKVTHEKNLPNIGQVANYAYEINPLS
jgi:hypothetical protein